MIAAEDPRNRGDVNTGLGGDVSHRHGSPSLRHEESIVFSANSCAGLPERLRSVCATNCTVRCNIFPARSRAIPRLLEVFLGLQRLVRGPGAHKTNTSAQYKTPNRLMPFAARSAAQISGREHRNEASL